MGQAQHPVLYLSSQERSEGYDGTIENSSVDEDADADDDGITDADDLLNMNTEETEAIVDYTGAGGSERHHRVTKKEQIFPGNVHKENNLVPASEEAPKNK